MERYLKALQELQAAISAFEVEAEDCTEYEPAGAEEKLVTTIEARCSHMSDEIAALIKLLK